MVNVVQQPVRIAVNVMRARLTVIGFNIAIVSFQIGQIPLLSGGVNLPAVDHPVHVLADIELYMALALSIISLIAFIMSCEFDEVGVCSHWSILIGDLLMYMALAYTLAGFFSPLGSVIRNVAETLEGMKHQAFALQKTVVITGGFAWFLAMYAGPVVTLCRSPFSLRCSAILGTLYVVLVVTMAWVTAQAEIIEALQSDMSRSMVERILWQLVQPLTW